MTSQEIRNTVRNKFRYEKSETENDYIDCAPQIHLQKEVMDNLNSEDFRTLKRTAQKELGVNLMIDDELFMSVLDRLCYLENKIK